MTWPPDLGNPEGEESENYGSFRSSGGCPRGDEVSSQPPQLRSVGDGARASARLFYLVLRSHHVDGPGPGADHVEKRDPHGASSEAKGGTDLEKPGQRNLTCSFRLEKDRVRIDSASLKNSKIWSWFSRPRLNDRSPLPSHSAYSHSRSAPLAYHSGGRCRLSVEFFVRHQRPGDARQPVGRCQRNQHLGLTRQHLGQPRSGRSTSPDHLAHHAHFSRDQQPPHVAQAHLRYPTQSRLAASRQ